MNKTNALKKPPACTPKLYEQEGLGENALVYAHYLCLVQVAIGM